MSPFRNAGLLAIAFAFSIACGAAPVAPVAPVRPSGPAPSALHTTPVLFVRLDLALLETVLSPSELDAIDRAVARALGLGDEGAELVAHLDALAASTASPEWDEGPSPESWRLAARHRISASEARTRFERALDTSPLAWREQQGITSTQIVGDENSDSYLVAWSDVHEVVLAPQVDRSEVLRVLRDHAARRVDVEPVEPALVFDRDLIAEVRAADAPSAVQRIDASADLRSLSARIYRTLAGARLSARFVFATPEAARTAEETLRPMIEVFSRNPVFTMLQIDGVLTNLTLTVEREVIRVETLATWDEVSTIIRILGR